MNVNKIFVELELICSKVKELNIEFRVFGSAGIYLHCPEFRYYFELFDREVNDIDLIGRLSESTKLVKLLKSIGFEEDVEIKRLFGFQRRIFYKDNGTVLVDVVFEKLHFCHDIDLRKRLKLDFPTISVTDLLLSKFQKVELDDIDLLDISVLLLEHYIGNTEDDIINVDYISDLCSRNWGFWKTVNLNLNELEDKISTIIKEPDEIKYVIDKLMQIRKTITNSKKSILWKLRSIFGEKIKWFRDVDKL
ncbi:MAG: hypothetical protein A2161_18310, partial [Candidatus Schekmanbacteria bacterium RBG_13_48_7]